MRPASYRSTAYGSHTPIRARVAAALLAVGLVVALLLALFTLGFLPDVRRDAEAILATFDVVPPPASGERTASEPAAKKAQPPARPDPPQPPPPQTPVLPPTEFTLPGVIAMTREQYAAADIGKIASSPAPADGASAAAAEGSGSEGVGEGPDGQTLYNAQWQREPTDAELSTYMPKRGVRTGWGLIACRTIARNRVEDCRELDETPGSGIARGMRRAAWQFLIVPPRVDGKPVIGAWVRIRFDLTTGIAQ